MASVCRDAQAPARCHRRNRIRATIERHGLVDVAGKFSDGAKAADTPPDVGISQLFGEKTQGSWCAHHRILPPLVDGAELGGAAVVAAPPDDTKLDGVAPICTFRPP